MTKKAIRKTTKTKKHVAKLATAAQIRRALKITRRDQKVAEEAIKRTTKRAIKQNKSKVCLSDFAYIIEPDPNFEDNANITFARKSLWDAERKVDENWTKEEHKAIGKLAKDLELDEEPIMPCVYSFDTFTQDRVRNELGKLGMNEVKPDEVDVAKIMLEANSNVEENKCDGCEGCNGSGT